MKIAKVKLSKQFLEMIIKAEVNIEDKITTDAPKDLEILGFLSEGDPWTFTAVVKSETFPELQEGAAIPLISPFVYVIDLK